jgi:hypothetical protein
MTARTTSNAANARAEVPGDAMDANAYNIQTPLASNAVLMEIATTVKMPVECQPPNATMGHVSTPAIMPAQNKTKTPARPYRPTWCAYFPLPTPQPSWGPASAQKVQTQLHGNDVMTRDYQVEGIPMEMHIVRRSAAAHTDVSKPLKVSNNAASP